MKVKSHASQDLATKQQHQELSLDQMKVLMPVYLETYLADRIAYQTPGSFTLHCPLHGEDARPSCSVDGRSGTWLFHCHACGASGSLIDLHAQLTGLEPMSRANLRSLENALNVKLVNSNNTRSRSRQPVPKTDNAQLTERVWEDLESYLQPYHRHGTWKLELTETSPVPFTAPDSWNPHSMLRGLYQPNDVLWMGDVNDTGQRHHAACFKPQAEWLGRENLPPRLASGTFKADSISRSKGSVSTAPYIILESDNLIGHKPVTQEDKAINQCLNYGLARYAQEELGLVLRAVVDTGNKSLHSWFDHPGENNFQILQDIADGLRLDRAVLERGSSSPLRAPGCKHEESDISSSLLYLNPKF